MYIAKSKFSFLFGLLWKDSKKLLLTAAAQIPLLVILPYAKLFLTKILVEGIEKQYVLHFYILAIIGLCLLQLVLMALKEWIAGTSDWNSKYLINSLLRPLDEKSMCTGYAYVESATGQNLRQKALNSVYRFGQSAIAKSVSCAANLVGVILYGVTIGSCNVVILGIIAVTTGLSYLLTGLLRRYELAKKEVTAELDRKILLFSF